jgi:hypothetical protein
MIYSTCPRQLEITFSINQVYNPLIIACLDSNSEKSEQTELKKINFKVLITKQLIGFDISGKTPQDTLMENDKVSKDAYVTIDNVWINDILIEQWTLDNFCKFYPRYDQSQIDYAQTHSIQLPSEIKNFSQPLYFNGRFEIDVDNFFDRYHGVLMGSLNDYNNWVKYSHLGWVDPEKKQELLNIIENL